MEESRDTPEAIERSVIATSESFVIYARSQQTITECRMVGQSEVFAKSEKKGFE